MRTPLLIVAALSSWGLGLQGCAAPAGRARLEPEAAPELPAPSANHAWAADPAAVLRRAEAAGPGATQQAEVSNSHAAAQANNPLANLTAFNIHNYYIPELSGTDEEANQAWLRFAKPFEAFDGSWLFRGSLPISRFPTGPDDSESGLGDFNAFATYLFDTDDPGLSFGAGPLVTLPTASDEVLGTDQWSLGGAVVLFDARDQVVQYGGLVTYQHKIAGSSKQPDVNLFSIQPFGFLQLGGGHYLRTAPIWAFDLETGNFNVPIGFGYGKVHKVGTSVVNFFVEPQFTVLDDGPGQPEFQLFMGLNLQFY